MPQRRAPQQQTPAAPAGGAPAQPEGAMNLGQAADQMGGLNLFGEQNDGAPADDKEPKRGRNRAKPEDDEEEHDDTTAGEDGQDDDEGDDESGSQDTGQSDDDAANDEGDDQDEDEGEATGEQDADSDDGDQPEVKTLTDLAAALEVEPDFFDNLELTFKADGEDVTVNVAELRQGYQRDANYRRQTQELADTRRQYDTQEQQRQQHFEANVVQLGQVLQQGEQLLVGQLNTAEMQELRQKNPAEWAARREEMQQRINGVKQLYAYASQQYDTFKANQAAATKTALEELRRNEMANLQIAVPDWGDEVRTKLTGYLDSTYGYTESDLAQVFDSRLIAIANKARLFDEMQEVGKRTKKKVSKLPKTQKPSKGQGRSKTGNVANIRKARSRLKQTGKVKDAAALIGLSLKDI